MKHYEVNFVDRTVETVMSDGFPPLLPQYVANKPAPNELEVVPVSRWWSVTLLVLDTTQAKLVPHGRIHINLDNVTYIKET